MNRVHRCRRCQEPGHNVATCINPPAKAPPRVLSDEAIERNRKAARERYIKKGGQGGRRIAGPAIRIEKEGSITHLHCRCGARLSTTEDAQTVADRHLKACPLATKRRRVMPDRATMSVIPLLFSLVLPCLPWSTCWDLDWACAKAHDSKSVACVKAAACFRRVCDRDG